MKIQTLKKKLYVVLVLLFVSCSLSSCLWWADGGDSTDAGPSVQQVLELRNRADIKRMAISMEENLYGTTANSYDAADPTFTAATRYWATTLCGRSETALPGVLTSCSVQVNNRSVVDPGNLVCDGKTCTETAAGNLQSVPFVTGAFTGLGSSYTLDPVPDNGKDFWTRYQGAADWSTFSPQDIVKGHEGPTIGDIVSFTNDSDANGHVGIVVGLLTANSSYDGYIIVAGANQTGNLTAAELTDLNATRGNFYKIPWSSTNYQTSHGGDLFRAWPGMHVQGFIRHINYKEGTTYIMGTPVASVVAMGTTGANNGLSGTWPDVNVDPYQDPILKNLLATAQFQSADKRTLVQDAWNVGVRFGIPPQYFILQVYEESGFDVNNSTLGAHGLIQITSDTLHLVGTDGESSSPVATPNCVFDPNALPDCMNNEANLPAVTQDSANNNALYNLEVGARTMLDKLIYNLAPVAQQMSELTTAVQQSGQATVPRNAKVQACMNINFSFARNPGCLEGLARAMVSYNGGQSVTNGYKNRQMDNSCVQYFTADPHQWLLCVWNNQEHRDPGDSTDGNHPDTGEWAHEAGRYIVNIFDYLPNHLNYCEGDNTSDRVQQACLDDVNRYPGIL